MFTSASQSTLPDGQVSTTFVTFFSSVPTQTVTLPPSPGLNNSGNNSTTGNSNIGPIIGGVLGGFFGLLLLAGAFIWYVCAVNEPKLLTATTVGVVDADGMIFTKRAPYMESMMMTDLFKHQNRHRIMCVPFHSVLLKLTPSLSTDWLVITGIHRLHRLALLILDRQRSIPVSSPQGL